MVRRLLPEELVGSFFGVGSLSVNDPEKPLEYVSTMRLPYWYQLPALPEEDMVRQFAYVIDGFEDEELFTLDIDVHTFQEVLTDDTPIEIDADHAHGLYLMRDLGRRFEFFKTQQTAPATMCFTIRDPDGHQLISKSMVRFFASLMRRIAVWQYQFLKNFCDTIILCQDDPALGFVIQMIRRGEVSAMDPRWIVRETDSVYPSEIIPSYHYCEDWRTLYEGEKHLLWDGSPKIVHIDLVAYPPDPDEKGAEAGEKINRFIERGGAIALGVLPNVDDGYKSSVLETLRERLTATLSRFVECGVDKDLLAENALISTQCGLSRASPRLAEEIHRTSQRFPEVLRDCVRQTT